jgi:hypothetical protein
VIQIVRSNSIQCFICPGIGYEQLQTISQSKFIPILVSQQNQLDEDRKRARRQMQQAAPGSETYQ